MTDLNNLGQLWLAAKAEEAAAAKKRIEIEGQIIAITGKRDEGSKTHDTGSGMSITVTGKMTRKMDWEAWKEVCLKIPQQLWPVKQKPELDEAGVKWLKENQPELYAILPIEVKPAKTAVDVKVKAA